MTDNQQELFGEPSAVGMPLAARMRPEGLDGFFGQAHILAPGRPLRIAIEQGTPHSFVLWGPPGVGKTTLARIAASASNAEFIALSAVLSGVADIRDAIKGAKARRAQGRGTVLFIDEVHRFNKAQQDAFLPHVEDGTVTFIGATTENPSFELNSALVSRVRVYRLLPLGVDDLETLMKQALEQGFDNVDIDAGSLAALAQSADGDARRALNQLELATDIAEASEDGRRHINSAVVEEISRASLRRFDKGGDVFYDLISALHKSVRGSDPDASLYWFTRMLDGGCDPLYIARRVVRMASEDVGNADPRALELALNSWQVQERLGSPEGELAIAQAILYLAAAPKSNAVYRAFKTATRLVAESPSHEVPLHLRNAPTRLMKNEGFGAGYRYAHDEPEAFAAGEHYFPETMEPQRFYNPVDRGLELRIREKLDHLAGLNAAAPADLQRRGKG